MLKITVRIYDAITVFTEGEIICEDEFINWVLLQFPETMLSGGPHLGYLPGLNDIFGDNWEVISVEGEDPDVIH